MKRHMLLTLGLVGMILLLFMVMAAEEADCNSDPKAALGITDDEPLIPKGNITSAEDWEKKYTALQEDYDNLYHDYQQATLDNEELEKTNNDVEEEKNNLQSLYDELYGEVTELEETYPPRDFMTEDELVAWANANVTAEETSASGLAAIENAREIQAAALQDGFILNVEEMTMPDTEQKAVCVTTYIGNKKYYWHPAPTPHIWWLLMQ